MIPPHGRPQPPGLALALIRMALSTYPARFRRRHGEDMEAAFRDGWTDAAALGRAAAARFTLRTSLNLVRTGLGERLFPSPGLHDPRYPNDQASLMDALRQDVRYAVRALLRRPGFTAVAILTLALGVGANTAIFSVVNGVLLTPLPYDQPDRLVTVWAADTDDPGDRSNMSKPDIQDVAATDAFEVAVGHASGDVSLTGMGEAEVIEGARVTQGLLEVFGLQPLLGRDLRPEEAVEGAPDVVVVSHAFWRERLGGDPGALGRSLELEGRSFEIVGVAPEGFDFPGSARLWRPYPMDPEGCARGCHILRSIGRLAPGVTVERARQEMGALAERLQAEHPDTNHEKVFNLIPLQDLIVADVRTGLWVLLAAVGLVLLIACANVANLLLVRAQARTGEVAVRAALGASGRRLAGQVMVESVVLSVVGGACGLLLAAYGVEGLRALAPADVPRLDMVALDGTVLLFALALVGVVALLFGAIPALRLARTSPALGLGAGGRGGSSRGEARSRSLLLVTEVGLSLVLLVGAGLLLKSFARLIAVDPGYDTEQVVRFTLSLPDARYPGLDEVGGFYRRMEERIAAMPDVASVGSLFGAPLGRGNAVGTVSVDGRPEPPRGQETYAAIRPATPGYFETLSIPVLRGRGLAASDGPGDVPVAVVSERFVQQNFPGEDPLGARVELTIDFGYGSPMFTIVGVVPDVMSESLTDDTRPALYVPLAQMGPGFATVHVRGRAGAPSLVPRLRDVVRELDSDLPVRNVETLEEVVARQLAPTRFYLTLLGLFAALAVVLAAVGLYGVVAYLVSRRTREIGVRMAMGADRRSITRLVLGQGMRPAAWGLALGLLAAFLGSRVLESLLFEVEPTDPVVFVGVAVLLASVVVAATLLPARSATRVDPVEALRAE
ncbi:MAG: ABC transporter permease [Gemmatimonadetes bacterium]|nr:ABC transporter permease [Gemmatimonadota bacterium]